MTRGIFFFFFKVSRVCGDHLFSFLILRICGDFPVLLNSLVSGLSVLLIFSKNMLLVLFLWFVFYFVDFCSLVLSFPLFTLDLICFSFSKYLPEVETRLLILDIAYFLSMYLVL